MACEDQINTQDLINAKTDATTLGEVATSRAGAIEGGAPITTSTNRFGEVTDTIQGILNKLGIIYDDPIRDWSASLLVSDLRAHRYPATTGDIYIPTKPLPFTTGGTFNTDDWVILQGLTAGTLSAELINDTSQAYEFETLNDAVIFDKLVLDKVVHIKDVDETWDVSTEAANGNQIIASTGTPAFTLKYRAINEVRVFTDIAEATSTLNLTIGERFVTVDTHSSLYEVQVSGVNDQFDSFLLNNGAYAFKVSSLSGDQYYSYKQRKLLGEAMKIPRDGNATSTPFQVTWYGDSNSVRDSLAVQTQFADTLIASLPGPVATVINRANSGYTAKVGFESHLTNHSGHVTVINYGTNDASIYTPLNNVQEYLYWMEQLLVRELNWGHPVVFVTPLPTRYDKAWETYTVDSPSDLFPAEKRIDAYQMGNALKYLGDKYSVPVIDSVEMMAGYKDEMFAGSTQSINVGTPFGDVVHLATGFAWVWGTRIAAQFLGDLMLKGKRVKSGDMIGVTHGYDAVTVSTIDDMSDKYKYFAASAETAFASGDNHVGNRCIEIAPNERVVFPFYADQDNLVVYPIFESSGNSHSLVYLDNRGHITPPRLDLNLDGADLGTSEVDYTSGAHTTVNRPQGYAPLTNASQFEINESIWIATKGWHLITFLCITGTMSVSGLEVRDIHSQNLGAVGNYLTGDMEDSRSDGVMRFAFAATTNKPAAFTSGFFNHIKAPDGSFGLITFTTTAPTQGEIWTKTFISNSWGAWVKS